MRRRQAEGPAGLACLLTVAVVLVAGPVQAQQSGTGSDHRAPIALAAERFGLSPDLIAKVIAAESAGDEKAVSPKGAMGLMQLMPATWRMLRVRLDLGPDPFDPRDNILAGAAYLRELHDRYGSPGFLAAYNAGPGRYEQSLLGRPLPGETLAYVARLSRGELDARSGKPAHPAPWTQAQLFAPRWSLNSDAADRRTDVQAGAPRGGETPKPSALFAPRGEPTRRP